LVIRKYLLNFKLISNKILAIMFEQYIESNWKRNIAPIDNQKDVIRLIDVINIPDLDKYVKVFLNAELEWLIYREKIKFLSNPNIDANNALKDYNEYEKILRSNIIVKKRDLVTKIEFASKIHINYLVRPIFSLKRFIFGSDFSKPANEIILKLNYFSEYYYLINDIADFINEKIVQAGNSIQINSDTFSEVIQEIDNYYINFTNKTQFEELFSPIINYFNVFNQVIPIDSLILFFDDKEKKNVVDLLFDIKVSKGEIITNDNFRNILMEIYNEISINIPDTNEDENIDTILNSDLGFEENDIVQDESNINKIINLDEEPKVDIIIDNVEIDEESQSEFTHVSLESETFDLDSYKVNIDEFNTYENLLNDVTTITDEIIEQPNDEEFNVSILEDHFDILEELTEEDEEDEEDEDEGENNFDDFSDLLDDITYDEEVEEDSDSENNEELLFIDDNTKQFNNTEILENRFNSFENIAEGISKKLFFSDDANELQKDESLTNSTIILDSIAEVSSNNIEIPEIENLPEIEIQNLTDGVPINETHDELDDLYMSLLSKMS